MKRLLAFILLPLWVSTAFAVTLRPEAVKLSAAPIRPVPVSLLRPFINLNQIYEEDVLNHAPYVVGFSDEHLIGGTGDHIYVKDLRGAPDQNFGIFREDGRFYDAEHALVLGYNAAFIAKAVMVKPGNPATLVVADAQERVEIGDRIMPLPRESASKMVYPHPAHIQSTATIIHTPGSIGVAGAQQVVLIDKGIEEGIDNGALLTIINPGKKIIDPVYHDRHVRLPDEHIGRMMVFRTFDHVSYGLVLNANRPIQLGDYARHS